MTNNGKLIKDAMDSSGKNRETKQHPPKGRSVSSKNILPKQIVKMTPYATGGSIVDYLDSIGQDSSIEARALLAQKHNIGNYTGTADQNIALLNALQSNKATPSSVKGKQKPVDFTNVYQGSLTTNPKFQKAASKQVLPSMYDAMINNPMNGGDHSGATLSAQQQAMQNNLAVGPGKQPLKKFTDKDTAALKKMGYKGDMKLAAETQNKIDSVAQVNQGFHTSAGVDAFRSIPLPENIKANALYLSNRLLGVGDNRMNQDNLSDEQKLVLYKAYKDQLAKHPDQSNHGAISYSNYGDDISNQAIKGEGSMLSKIGRSFTDPTFEMSHTVGGANYWSAPNSDDVYITDKYDFNNKGDKTKKKFDTPTPSAYQYWRNMMGDVEKTNPSQADLYDRDVNIKLSKKDMEKRLAAQQPKKKGGSTFSGNAWYKKGGSTFSGNAWYGDGGNFYAATPNFIQDTVFDIYKMYGGDIETGGEQMKEGGIHINPANKGKFNATKQRTGKSTEELTHSSNPVTRKRAIFAQNAAKWHHADGGLANVSLLPLSKEMQQQMQDNDNAYMIAPVDPKQQAQQQAEAAFRQQYPNAPINAPISDWSNTQFSSQQINPFTSNLPDAQVVTKNQRYANKMNKLSDGLMNQTFGNPFSLYNMAHTASNIVGGINNHKQMKEDISRENFNYSTMGMNPIADPGDGSRGFRPVSGTQRNKEIPNRIGGNYSFNGMNQANYNPYRAALGLSVDNVFSPGESYSVPEQQYMGGNEMPQQQVFQAGPSAPDMTNAPVPAAANAGSYNDVASFIKKMEGFQKKASWDYAQNSVGYGSKAKHAGEIITREEAEQRLDQELQPIIEKIQSKVKVPLTQGQLMALASINYNTGSLANSLIKEINNGADPKEIEQRIKTMALTGVGSKKILPGLVNRRKEEAALFGRGYADGGVVELTGDQIMQIRAMGGDVEFID